MINMFRARWYELTRMITFWGFLVIVCCFALLAADSTLRNGNVPMGFDFTGLEWQLLLAPLAAGAALLCHVSLLGYDERVGTAKTCLVGPASRTQWVLAGLLCFAIVLGCYTALFHGIVDVVLGLSGYLPSITPEGLGRFLGFVGAMTVVTLAYGCLLSLIMVVCRRTAVGVLALALLLGGAVEKGCAALLELFGAGAWAVMLEPYTLFGQFSALGQGAIPEAGALLLAGLVAVAAAAAAVAVFQRRNLG